jgi:hypothetical protein
LPYRYPWGLANAKRPTPADNKEVFIGSIIALVGIAFPTSYSKAAKTPSDCLSVTIKTIIDGQVCFYATTG